MGMSPIASSILLAHIGDHRVWLLVLDLQRRNQRVLGLDRHVVRSSFKAHPDGILDGHCDLLRCCGTLPNNPPRMVFGSVPVPDVDWRPMCGHDNVIRPSHGRLSHGPVSTPPHSAFRTERTESTRVSSPPPGFIVSPQPVLGPLPIAVHPGNVDCQNGNSNRNHPEAKDGKYPEQTGDHQKHPTDDAYHLRQGFDLRFELRLINHDRTGKLLIRSEWWRARRPALREERRPAVAEVSSGGRRSGPTGCQGAHRLHHGPGPGGGGISFFKSRNALMAHMALPGKGSRRRWTAPAPSRASATSGGQAPKSEGKSPLRGRFLLEHGTALRYTSTRSVRI